MSRAVAIVIVAAELLGDANEEYVNGTGRAGHRTARLVSLVFTRPDAFSHQAQRKLGLLLPENFFNSPADDLVIGEAIGLLCRTVEIGVNEAAVRRGAKQCQPIRECRKSPESVPGSHPAGDVAARPRAGAVG